MTHEEEQTEIDPDARRRALAKADMRVLLMTLFQMSGDRVWLSRRYRPERDVRLIADETAGLSAEIRAEIVAAAERILADPGATPAIAVPDDDLMVEMMSACLGEAVPPEYAGMMREEMGLVSRQVDWTGGRATGLEANRPVAIVGAGASGIALGANLLKLGIPFVILEKNDEVGGTWLENRYPGCGVDTPNHAYSFSFGERYRWSRYFSPRDEIQDYLERSADDLGLRPHIRFGTRVGEARWDERKACWTLSLQTPAGEDRLDALALVSAIGQLSLPSIPKIAGADAFAGPIFHTAHWPDDLDLSGRRVAVIGTGASSMQIVPTIADQVESLTIYQRSAQWARPIPRYHEPIGADGQWLLQHVPFYAGWYRFAMLWRYGDGLLPSLHKDPDWPHPERSLNRANDRHRQQMTAFLEETLEGRPDLIAKCLPSYPPYGKRILLDNGWYEALRKPGVELVTDAIECIEPDAVRTRDGERREADIVVLATGFQVTQMTARLNVTGRNGQALEDVWADDNPTAYLGITVPGFPNLFCMQGPNTGLGHGGSAIFQAECQARYIAGCLVAMLEEKLAAIDVRPELHDAYIDRVDAEHERMIWTHPGMSTYYRNARGRVVSVMPWRLVDYWAMTHDPRLADYRTTPRVA